MIALPLVMPTVRGRDAAASLCRALIASAATHGLAVAVEPPRTRRWASATFTGVQVSVAMDAPRAPTLGRWIAELPLADLPMRGHLVASLAVDTIEDDGAVVRTSLTVLVIDAD